MLESALHLLAGLISKYPDFSERRKIEFINLMEQRNYEKSKPSYLINDLRLDELNDKLRLLLQTFRKTIDS